MGPGRGAGGHSGDGAGSRAMLGLGGWGKCGRNSFYEGFWGIACATNQGRYDHGHYELHPHLKTQGLGFGV